MNKQKLVDIFNKHTPSTEMTKDETMIMFQLLMSKDDSLSKNIDDIDKESEIYQHFAPLIDSHIGQIFLKRIKILTSLKISIGALTMLMQHMETPGSAVMHVFYLYYKLPEDTLVTVETFGEVFPMGFFNNKQLKEIWSAQKVNTDNDKEFACIGAPDNMIDYLESWR